MRQAEPTYMLKPRHTRGRTISGMARCVVFPPMIIDFLACRKRRPSLHVTRQGVVLTYLLSFVIGSLNILTLTPDAYAIFRQQARVFQRFIATYLPLNPLFCYPIALNHGMARMCTN